MQGNGRGLMKPDQSKADINGGALAHQIANQITALSTNSCILCLLRFCQNELYFFCQMREVQLCATLDHGSHDIASNDH